MYRKGTRGKRLSRKLSRLAERPRIIVARRAREAAQLEAEPDGRKAEDLRDAAQLDAEPDGRKAEEYDGRKGRASGAAGSCTG
jgi:hypothetical protein